MFGLKDVPMPDSRIVISGACFRVEYSRVGSLPSISFSSDTPLLL